MENMPCVDVAAERSQAERSWLKCNACENILNMFETREAAQVLIRPLVEAALQFAPVPVSQAPLAQYVLPPVVPVSSVSTLSHAPTHSNRAACSELRDAGANAASAPRPIVRAAAAKRSTPRRTWVFIDVTESLILILAISLRVPFPYLTDGLRPNLTDLKISTYI